MTAPSPTSPSATVLDKPNPLTTLIRRLEAATSRLEDIASSATDPSAQHVSAGQLATGAAGGMHQSSSAPELPATAENASKARDTATHPPVPTQITEMDALLDEHAKNFASRAKELGDKAVEEQARAVEKAFADQRRFVLVSTRAKKPDMTSSDAAVLISDLQADMSAVGEVRESNRASPYKDQLSMVAEGIGALQWLVMDGKPADFVGEIIGGAQMFGNRVLSANKEKDGGQPQVKYVQAYYGLLKALQSYIKKHYPSGVTWNNNGIPAPQAWKESLPSDSSSDSSDSTTPTTNGAASSGGAPPPPPPPPPMPNFDNAGGPPPPPPGPAPQNKSQPADMGAVFSELNRGEEVTKGLKKVDKSQMTHKNPSLRTQQTTSTPDSERSRSRGPDPKPKPASMRQNSATTTSTPQTTQPKRQPKKELDGNKWLIENHDSPSSPIELEVEISQSILITRCTNTTIILKGKANAISIDNSPRTQILLDTLVSSVDVIKCPGFALQVTGSLPTVMLDQVDGAQIFLPAGDVGTEVLSSKSSSVNVVLPPREGAGEEADSSECPLPEQMRSFVKNGKLVTEIVEHAG
ncbi:hypothetical protein MBLNU230_g5018t1 [Neophaeotheca triangularis]